MIQIIDGFNLQTSTPIDSRIVVADDTERALITSTYPGLRIWQVDTNTPYFWDESTGTPAWKSELDLVVTGVDGNVTDGKIPKFTSINPTKIEDSQISDDGTTVTIDGILDVGGDLIFDGELIGDINADNITQGLLNLDRLYVGSGGVDDVLQIDITGVPKFVSLSGISIGSSSTSNQVKLNDVNDSQYYRFILREESTTPLDNSFDLYSYTTDLLLSQNSTSMCILAHGGSKENPPYSFYDTTSNNILGGIYSDNSISVSYGNTEVGRFDDSGFKTIYGSESSPSISFIGDMNTGIYRPLDNVISFSTDGNETVRMDTNGFKTILGSSTNPSISSFGTKTFSSGGFGGGSSTSNFEDTGFYFNSNYYGPSAGIVKQLNFVTDGDDILSFNNHGINIFTNGTNVLPSISFTGIGSHPSGINGGEHYVSLVTGQIERFRVEGGSAFNQNTGSMYLYGNVNVEDNLYLPQPNDSSPSAGKVLTSVDNDGKVEWSENPVALHEPFYYHETDARYPSSGNHPGNGGERTISTLTIYLPDDSKKYIVHVNFKCRMVESDGTESDDTGITIARILLNGSTVDTSVFRLDMNYETGNKNEWDNWQFTHNCFWTGELIGSGQNFQFTHENTGSNTDWHSENLAASVIGIPVNS